MAEHNELGLWGEAVAADYLTAKGYSIVERSFKLGHYELDIIAMDGDEIVFVEVKTRSDGESDPIDAIDEAKISFLSRAADRYLSLKRIPHSPRFDVITIVGRPGETYRLTHYTDAFLPPINAY